MWVTPRHKASFHARGARRHGESRSALALEYFSFFLSLDLDKVGWIVAWWVVDMTPGRFTWIIYQQENNEIEDNGVSIQ